MGRLVKTAVLGSFIVFLTSACASVKAFPGSYPWEVYGKVGYPNDRFDPKENASFSGNFKQGAVIAEFPEFTLNLFGEKNTETRFIFSAVSKWGVSSEPFPWANRITIGPELKMEHKYRPGRLQYGFELDYDCRRGDAERFGGRNGCEWNPRFVIEFFFNGDLKNFHEKRAR